MLYICWCWNFKINLSCPIWVAYSLWGQNVCTINQLFILQKKELRLIHFKERNAHPDKIKIENCLFLSKYVNNKLLPIFNSWFTFSSTCHNYESSFAAKVHLKIPTVTATTYGKGAFISMATKTWNNTQSQYSLSKKTENFSLWLLFESLTNPRLHSFFWHMTVDDSFFCINCNDYKGFLVVW